MPTMTPIILNENDPDTIAEIQERTPIYVFQEALSIGLYNGRRGGSRGLVLSVLMSDDVFECYWIDAEIIPTCLAPLGAEVLPRVGAAVAETDPAQAVTVLVLDTRDPTIGTGWGVTIAFPEKDSDLETALLAGMPL